MLFEVCCIFFFVLVNLLLDPVDKDMCYYGVFSFPIVLGISLFSSILVALKLAPINTCFL